MAALRGKIADGGRLSLPADVRRSMGLAKGDAVVMELHGDELRIRPVRSTLRRIQAKLRPSTRENGLVSDELIAERRAEAAREQD